MWCAITFEQATSVMHSVTGKQMQDLTCDRQMSSAQTIATWKLYLPWMRYFARGR